MIQFLNHRGYPVPSPACLQEIGDAFRRRVASFAEATHIPVVRLKAADRNIEVMRPTEEGAEAGRSQVAAIGVTQEMQRVFIARKRDTDPARCPQFSFDKKDRRVTVFSFYLWDAGFGRFIDVCTYCPWPVKIWVDGHHGPTAARKVGLGFTELPNGFAAADDPAPVPEDLTAAAGTVEVFFQRWLTGFRWLGPADQQAGYWWECSMAQVEVSRTIVFTAPRHARYSSTPWSPTTWTSAARNPRDHLRPAGPVQHRRRVQDQCDHPRHRGHHERLLQALADQAIPERRPRPAGGDRDQRARRPGLPAAPAQPR